MSEIRYDALNRPTEWIDPAVQSKFVTYDAAGRVATRKDELARITTLGYDGIGRQISETQPDPDGVGPLASPVIQFAFDAAGNLIKETDALNNSTLYNFDALQRMIRTTDAIGGVTETVFDLAGQISSTVDPLGRSSLFEYDVRGRLIRRVQPDPDLADTVLAPETEFAYDAVGNLVSTTDALDRITATEYDSLNRPVYEILPQPAPVSTVQVIDNGTAGFATTGSWGPLQIGGQNVGYGATLIGTVPGIGSDTATWTFSSLTSGYYRVWTTWFANDQLASNAPYTVSDSSQLLSTIVVDQTESPDDLVASSWSWEALGGPYFIGSGTLKVQLSDLANGDFVLADAVRIERINPGTLSAYDPNGNRVSVTDELGHTTGLEYDGVGRLKKTTQPDPDGTGSLPAPFSVNTFDSLGNLTVQTDHLNRVTTREYDALHRLTKEFQPDPDGISGPLGVPMTQYGYDAVGNLKTVTDPLLQVTSYDYDALNRRTKETLPDPDGTLTLLVAPITTYEFDAVGNLTTVTRPMNRVTKYDYDELNRRTKETLPDPDGSTGVLTSPVTTSTFDAVGNLTVMTDALGRITVYAYDRLNRRTRETLPDPDGSQGVQMPPVTQWAFDAVGNLVTKTDALNEIKTYEYDNRNRLEFRTDPDPDGPSNPGLAPRTKTVYDAVGNVTSTEVRQSATVNLVTGYTYDNLNRLKTETDAENRITTRTYNTAGLLWKLTDPKTQVTEFQYNDADWLTKEIDPTTAFSETKYNLVGLVSQQTDRRGKISEFSYDALNRLTEERWLVGAIGTAVIRTINKTYDNAGRLRFGTEKAQSGTRLSSVVYTYDSLDRPTIVENTGSPGVPATVMTYGYDAVGNQTSLSTTVGGVADFANVYSLDALNRVTRINQVKAAPTASALLRDKRIDLFYNALGQYTRIDRYEDSRGTEFVAASIYAYDETHRLTGLDHLRGGTVFADNTWTFDAAGRITGQNSLDGSVTFANDKTSQLTGADFTGQTDETYTYDAAGNRTNSGYVTTANNRVQSDGTYSYLYDAEGNRTSRTRILTSESTEYVWDHRQRLTTVTLKTSGGVKTKEITYAYDAFDRRISKDVNDGNNSTIDRSERYSYDGDDMAFVFTDSDGEGSAAAMALNSRMLNGVGTDELFADENALGEILWTLSDHQGTVRDVLDYNTTTNVSTVVNHVKYGSFGNILSEINPATGNPATAGRIGAGDILAGYTGREWDGDADLYYYRARWYDPRIGRFLSEDPQGFDAGDVNLTRYVGNSPWNYTDPTGTTRLSAVSPVLSALQGLSNIVSSVSSAYQSQAVANQTMSAFGRSSNTNINQAYSSWLQTASSSETAANPFSLSAVNFFSKNALGMPFETRTHGAGATWTGIKDDFLQFTSTVKEEFSQFRSEIAASRIYRAAVYGDFAQDTGIGGAVVQTVVGLVPFVGQAADARDSVAAIGAFGNGGWQRGSTYLNAGAVALAWVPGFDAVKGGKNVIKEGLQAGTRETVQNVSRTSPNSVVNTFSSGTGQYTGGPHLSIPDAYRIASDHGIDMRQFKLEHVPGNQYDWGSVGRYLDPKTLEPGKVVRAADGRIQVQLFDKALRSAQDLVETLSHELNHVRGYFKSGNFTSEAAAEAAAEAARPFIRN